MRNKLASSLGMIGGLSLASCVAHQAIGEEFDDFTSFVIDASEEGVSISRNASGFSIYTSTEVSPNSRNCFDFYPANDAVKRAIEAAIGDCEDDCRLAPNQISTFRFSESSDVSLSDPSYIYFDGERRLSSVPSYFFRGTQNFVQCSRFGEEYLLYSLNAVN